MRIRVSCSRARKGPRRVSASSRPASEALCAPKRGAGPISGGSAKHELVFAEGAAGTGKTWLAVGHAVSLLEQGLVERLVPSRPAVEARERLGSLPGDLREEVTPIRAPSMTRSMTSWMDESSNGVSRPA